MAGWPNAPPIRNNREKHVNERQPTNQIDRASFDGFNYKMNSHAAFLRCVKTAYSVVEFYLS